MQLENTINQELKAYLQTNYSFYADDKPFFKKIQLKLAEIAALDRESKTNQEHVREDPGILGTPNADISLDIAKFYKEHSVGRALTRLIVQKNCDPVLIYKKARIDRKLFSKIRSHDAYVPSKKTMIAFALSLELTLPETQEFLALGGYTLSKDIVFDVIISFFIEKEIYDIETINISLCEHEQTIF